MLPRLMFVAGIPVRNDLVADLAVLLADEYYFKAARTLERALDNNDNKRRAHDPRTHRRPRRPRRPASRTRTARDVPRQRRGSARASRPAMCDPR